MSEIHVASSDRSPITFATDSESEYDRFEDLTRRLLTVPKSEIDAARREVEG